MKVSAIPEMTAERDAERAIKKRERAALVLHARVELSTRPLQRFGDINRPARKNAAILCREGEHLVTRTVCPLDGRIEMDGLRRGIDYRRPSDTERVDIAARQRRGLHGTADRAPPQFLAGHRVERLNDIVLRCYKQCPGVRSGRTPVQGLGIHRACDTGVESAIRLERLCFLLRQRWNDILAASAAVMVIGQNRAVLSDSGHRPERKSK